MGYSSYKESENAYQREEIMGGASRRGDVYAQGGIYARKRKTPTSVKEIEVPERENGDQRNDLSGLGGISNRGRRGRLEEQRGNGVLDGRIGGWSWPRKKNKQTQKGKKTQGNQGRGGGGGKKRDLMSTHPDGSGWRKQKKR